MATLTPEQLAQQQANAAEHAAFVTKWKMDQGKLQAAALKSTATFAGFGVKDIAAFFGGTSASHALDIINRANKGDFGTGTYKTGLEHLAEHVKGSHYGGDFNVGNAILRAGTAAVTFGGSELTRNKPFQPGGEQRGVLGGTLAGPLTGGVGLGLAAVDSITAPPNLPGSTPAVPPASLVQQNARIALDKADAERRQQLATPSMFGTGLGLTGDATVKRSVLG